MMLLVLINCIRLFVVMSIDTIVNSLQKQLYNGNDEIVICQAEDFILFILDVFSNIVFFLLGFYNSLSTMKLL